MNLYRIRSPKHPMGRDTVSLTLQGTNTGVRPMNRKPFFAAAAAVLVSFGLAAAPEAEASKRAPTPSIVDLVINACDNPAPGTQPEFCILKEAVLAAGATGLAG